MALNQFSDMTFAEFKKLYLWSEPQVGAGGCGALCEPGAAGGLGAPLPPSLLQSRSPPLVRRTARPPEGTSCEAMGRAPRPWTGGRRGIS